MRHSQHTEAGQSMPSGDFRSEYQWFADEFDHYLINGFCLTFIVDKSADQVKDMLRSSTGAPLVDEDQADGLYITSLHDAERGSLMFEFGGHAAYTDSLAVMLARDTRIALVVHFSIGTPKFAHVENGALVCGFPIMDPDFRRGSLPDSLLPELTAAGLFPRNEPYWDEIEGEELEEEEVEGARRGLSESIYRILQAISVAARITDIPLTPHVLESPRYYLSLADLHRPDSPTSRPIF